MIQSPSKLESNRIPLFLDASVIINVAATGRSEQILAALDRQIIIEETVQAEFKRDPFNGGDSKPIISSLVGKQLLTVTTLSDEKYEIFIQLTGAAPPDDLGDGEAATIAAAADNGSVALDDRKALRIAKLRYPSMNVYSSLDIICSRSVFSALGERDTARAVNYSVKNARMHIPHPWKKWVADLLQTFPAEH